MFWMTGMKYINFVYILIPVLPTYTLHCRPECEKNRQWLMNCGHWILPKMMTWSLHYSWRDIIQFWIYVLVAMMGTTYHFVTSYILLLPELLHCANNIILDCAYGVIGWWIYFCVIMSCWVQFVLGASNFFIPCHHRSNLLKVKCLAPCRHHR